MIEPLVGPIIEASDRVQTTGTEAFLLGLAIVLILAIVLHLDDTSREGT